MEVAQVPEDVPDEVPAEAIGGLPITGIVIPVIEAEALLRSTTGVPRRLHGTDLVAHVTLLAPFHPEPAIDDAILGHLARFFADITPFGFELGELCEFPSGLTYLAPEPAGIFRRLTQQLHRLFPEFPPYGGAFDEIVPHLTVPLQHDEDVAMLRARLAPGLPLSVLATEAILVHVEEHGTTVIATLPFGTTAA